MLVRRAVFFPEAEAINAVQDGLEHLARLRREQGYRVRLDRAEIARDSPAFALATELDDMTAVEEHARLAKLNAAGFPPGSLRLPVRHELYSVQLPRGDATAAPRWVMRHVRRPRSGRGRDLGLSSIELAREHAMRGAHVSVLSQTVGMGSVSFVIEYELEGLKEWEGISARCGTPPRPCG